MARSKKTQPFGQVASRVLGRADSRGKRRGAAAVNAWETVVGEGIASHTRGFALREDGELVVYVDGAAWANQLSLMSSELMERLNAHLGEEAVGSLRFTVSRKTKEGLAAPAREEEPGESEGDAVAAVPLDEIEMAQASRVASAIKEEALRELALRVMVKDLEQKKALREDSASEQRKQARRKGRKEGL